MSKVSGKKRLTSTQKGKLQERPKRGKQKENAAQRQLDSKVDAIEKFLADRKGMSESVHKTPTSNRMKRNSIIGLSPIPIQADLMKGDSFEEAFSEVGSEFQRVLDADYEDQLVGIVQQLLRSEEERYLYNCKLFTLESQHQAKLGHLSPLAKYKEHILRQTNANRQSIYQLMKMIGINAENHIRIPFTVSSEELDEIEKEQSYQPPTPNIPFPTSLPIVAPVEEVVTVDEVTGVEVSGVEEMDSSIDISNLEMTHSILGISKMMEKKVNPIERVFDNKLGCEERLHRLLDQYVKRKGKGGMVTLALLPSSILPLEGMVMEQEKMMDTLLLDSINEAILSIQPTLRLPASRKRDKRLFQPLILPEAKWRQMIVDKVLPWLYPTIDLYPHYPNDTDRLELALRQAVVRLDS